jgi:hypothetical protein
MGHERDRAQRVAEMVGDQDGVVPGRFRSARDVAGFGAGDVARRGEEPERLWSRGGAQWLRKSTTNRLNSSRFSTWAQ